MYSTLVLSIRKSAIISLNSIINAINLVYFLANILISVFECNCPICKIHCTRLYNPFFCWSFLCCSWFFFALKIIRISKPGNSMIWVGCLTECYMISLWHDAILHHNHFVFTNINGYLYFYFSVCKKIWNER